MRADSLLHHGLLHGLQGNFCSSAWSASCPPSLALLSLGLFLALLSSLLSVPCSVPFLKYLSQVLCHVAHRAQLCPVVGLLELCPEQHLHPRARSHFLGIMAWIAGVRDVSMAWI